MEAKVTSEATGYEEFQDGPAPADLHKLAELAKSMFEAEDEVAKADKALKEKKAALRAIAERDIPELMEKCGVTEFATTTGLKLKIKRLLRASIAKANLTKAVAWLDKHGHGGLVKRRVFLDFTRDQEDDAKALRADLAKRGFENVETTHTVHSGTLSAWVKERRANGEAVPEKLLGVSEHSVAKLTTKD